MIIPDFEKIISNADILSPKFSRTTKAISADTKKHPEIGEMNVDSAVSIAAMNLFDCETHYGAIKPISSFNILILPTGKGKSFVFEKAMKPISDFKKKSDNDHSDNMSQFENEFEKWQIKHNGLKKQLEKDPLNLEVEKAFDKHQEIKPVLQERIVYSSKDFTMASLNGQLVKTGTAALAGAEMGRYYVDKMEDAQNVWCEGWDGDSPEFEKINRTSFGVPDSVRVSMAIAMQPRFIFKFGKKLNNKTIKFLEDGILYRCDVAFPDDDFEIPESVDISAAYEDHHTIITKLLVETDKALRDPLFKRKVLRLSTEAKELEKDILENVDKEMKPGGRLYYIQGLGQRIHEHILRRASRLHIYQGCEGDISVHHLKLAAAFCERNIRYFLKYLYYPPIEIRAVIELFEWIENRRGNGRDLSQRLMKRAHIQRYCPNWIRPAEIFDDAYKLLIQMGLINEVKHNFKKNSWDHSGMWEDYVDTHPSVGDRELYRYSNLKPSDFKEKLELW